jgi:predicted nucleic acid-binding protein
MNTLPITISPYRYFSTLPLLYADTCFYNRPFDNTGLPKVDKEIFAVQTILKLKLAGKIDLAWSYVLTLEVKKIKDLDQRTEILAWEKYAIINVQKSTDVNADALAIQATGIHKYDALHIACAINAKCQFFVTTDYRLLKFKDKRIYVCDPVECLEFL